MTTRRSFISIAGSLALGQLATFNVARGQSRKLRFGVGPYLPTTEDTRKSFTPIFAHLAKAVGAAGFDLAVTTDWAGLAVAMGSGQLDCAWMGPWGYVIANNATDCQAVATAKYDEKPTYHAIIVARPDLKLSRFPADTKGRSISFADVGSTSGWLIPSYYAREIWKIDPRSFWKYSEGASHPANEIAVQAGHVDLATDYDRNRNAMIEAGRVRPEASRIVWESDPLPNDAIAVPKSASPAFRSDVQKALFSIRPDEAGALLPRHYTGFVPATHETYRMIETAGLVLGRIKPKS
jgi:phosphonate transport system substrate-binding protein